MVVINNILLNRLINLNLADELIIIHTRERDRAGEAKKSLVEFGFGGLDDMMHAKYYSHGSYEVALWSSAASRIIINMEVYALFFCF